MMRDAAIAEFKKTQIDYEIITVPGVFEIPAAISFACEKSFLGYLVLGCVIRGETDHYDHVTRESAFGINKLAMKHKLAIGNGIVTANNLAQALERADPTKKNRAGAAARACLEMIKLKAKFEK